MLAHIFRDYYIGTNSDDSFTKLYDLLRKYIKAEKKRAEANSVYLKIQRKFRKAYNSDICQGLVAALITAVCDAVEAYVCTEHFRSHHTLIYPLLGALVHCLLCCRTSSSPSSWLQITSTSFDLTNQIWVSVAINSSSSSTLTQTISAGQYITALSLGTSTTQYPLTENNDPSFMLDSGTGYMYTSANGGNSWTQVTSMGTQLWESVSMSSTGQYQTAVTGNGLVYVSSDYGSTWALNNNISVNSSNTTGLATGSQPDNICMSSNGYNQSLSIYWVSNGSTNTSGSIYYSNYST